MATAVAASGDLSIGDLQRRLADLEAENATLRRLAGENEEEEEAVGQEERSRGHSEINVMSDSSGSDDDGKMRSQSSVAFNYDRPWDQLRFQKRQSVAIAAFESAACMEPQVPQAASAARSDAKASGRRKTTHDVHTRFRDEVAQQAAGGVVDEGDAPSVQPTALRAKSSPIPASQCAQKIPTKEPGLNDIDQALSHLADPDDVQTVMRAFIRYEREVRYLQSLISDYQDIQLTRISSTPSESQGGGQGRQQRRASAEA